MRLGVLADVHANLGALDAALGALDAAGCDALACAGDLVGYGPEPDACISRLRERGIPCAAGNHDLIAAGASGLEGCGPLAEATLRWTRRTLTDEARAFLGRLPAEVHVGEVVVTHGALGDPWRGVPSPDVARAELDRLADRHPEAAVLVVGHTHHPLIVGPSAHASPSDLRAGRRVPLGAGRHLVNPGAVGQSRQGPPRARCAVVDLAARVVEPLAPRYDVQACRVALAARGLPPEACDPRGGTAARLRAVGARVRARRGGGR